MDLALWILQALLALLFLGTGLIKLVRMQQRAAYLQLPVPQVLIVGVCEILGAAGLVLPMLLNIMTFLTFLAATGLAILMLLAAAHNVRLVRMQELIADIVLALLLMFIAYMR